MSFTYLYKDYSEGGNYHCRLSAEDEFDEIPCFHCQLADGDCLCDQPEQEGKCPFCVVGELNELIKDADEMASAPVHTWKRSPGSRPSWPAWTPSSLHATTC